ncbi:MAG TPA: hypothetical protein VGC37_14965, partial [Friedmanniella sp.]
VDSRAQAGIHQAQSTADAANQTATAAGTQAQQAGTLAQAAFDRLRRPNVVFVYLAGTREAIRRRMAAREHHFMPLSLLDSQLDTLEPPGPDEQVITVDLGGTPQDEVAGVLYQLGRP